MLQVQDQSMRPMTTAHLAQTMSLLVLSNAELQEKVNSELSTNPALELLEERVCPSCHRPLDARGICPICSLGDQKDLEPIVFLSPRDSIRTASKTSYEDHPPDQEPAAPENLAMNILQQLAADLQPLDRKLAAYILSSLDDDGFLQDHPAYIARVNRVPLTQVQHVLELISQADPPGMATMGPREALLAQLELFDSRLPSVSHAKRIIQETFKELGRRDFEAISRKLDIPVHKIRQAMTFIQDSLNPYPARAFWGSGYQTAASDPNVYHTPDIRISRNPISPDGALVVEIFTPLSGWLRVNPLFRKSLDNANGDQASEWSKHLERATLFVKCLQQRNNTMRRLMEMLVSEQRGFILEGDRQLTPMTRAEIAETIEVHESTISRAVSNKSVELPDGRIIPLSRFFDRSLSVRDRIKEIIHNEKRALTDEQIAERLSKEGVKVARRTVAKYRSIEGILPARLRHKKRAPRIAGVRV
jgi:RNA polymerase sigma-54 factor